MEQQYALAEVERRQLDAAYLTVTGRAVMQMLAIASARAQIASRARAESATSSCAHGHAVIPWAVTPVKRRVPSSVLTAAPCRV